MSTAAPTIPRASTLPLPNLRPARFEDYPQIQALESSHDLLTLPERDWRSIWLDNPLWPRLAATWPIGWVLEEASGRIVGSLANIPSKYAFRGRELVAATGRGWVVSAEYRGVAIWLMDEYFQQSGADLFINTTVNSMAVDPFSAFGSARVPLGDWESAAFWVTGYRGFAETALRVKHVPMARALSYFAGPGLKLKDLLTVARPSADSQDVSHAGEFDERFDGFWEALKSLNPGKLLGVRDRATLNWHFAGPMRAKQLWVVTANRGGQPVAYAIFKRQDHPPTGLVRMRLVDHQTLEPEVDHLTPMLGSALRRCQAEGIYSLEHVGCALPKMAAFDRLAPYRRKLPAWPYYYMANDPALTEQLRQPDAWDPSTFDGDASL